MAQCPICKQKEVQHRFRPFCSKRCSDVDLAKWMNDSYVISSNDAPTEEDEAQLAHELSLQRHKA